MSYLVMECHPGYAVLLDEEGRFLKAANLRYEIGQTVYDPVLMKETPEKKRHTIRWVSSGIAGNCRLFSVILWIQLLSKLYASLFFHLSDHQPGGADGLKPAGDCRETHGDK